MTARAEILKNIRQRLGASAEEVAQRRVQALAHLEQPSAHLLPERSRVTGPERLALFATQLQATGGSLTQLETYDDVPPTIAKLLESHHLPPTLRLGHEPLLQSLPWQKTSSLTLRFGPAEDDDKASLSLAFAAAAETGTLILTSGPNNPTTLNFLPELHLVLLPLEYLYGAYEEAFPRLRALYGTGQMPRLLNMISGPSRTADIEQTLVQPAHGPKLFQVILVHQPLSFRRTS